MGVSPSKKSRLRANYFFGALLSAGVIVPGDLLLAAAGELVAGVFVEVAGALLAAGVFEAAGVLVAGVLVDAAGVLFEAGGVTEDLTGADTDESAEIDSWFLILFETTVYKSTRPMNEMPRMRDARDMMSSNVALPL